MNMAYTSEYQEYRKKFEYIFNDKYESYSVEEKQLLNCELIIKTTYYSDESYEVLKHNVLTSQTEVTYNNGKIITVIKNIDSQVDLFSIIEHSDGKKYLVFTIDLYGYSVMDLSDYRIYHYIPEESFKLNAETFIWTEVLYCKKNNFLAVYGCFWACPYDTIFLDFTNPIEMPNKQICSAYDFKNTFNIKYVNPPLRWNDKGDIVLKCIEGGDIAEEAINIMSYMK
jgi:hypothetical protein